MIVQEMCLEKGNRSVFLTEVALEILGGAKKKGIQERPGGGLVRNIQEMGHIWM